jgi:hypothetical protein
MAGSRWPGRDVVALYPLPSLARERQSEHRQPLGRRTLDASAHVPSQRSQSGKLTTLNTVLTSTVPGITFDSFSNRVA